jgi:hypothetical protein
MAQAIAGRTKRDTYTVGLQGPKIDDNVLLTLMDFFPKRAVLLFEDIDSAGIGRESAEEDESPKWSERLAIRQWRSLNRSSNFTVSGLLNTIDGAQASLGHIIIMSECPMSTYPLNCFMSTLSRRTLGYTFHGLLQMHGLLRSTYKARLDHGSRLQW